MDGQIRKLGTAFLLGFALLALGAGYWQAWRGPALAASATNPRMVEEEKRAQRGKILDRSGRVLVTSSAGKRVSHQPALAHATGYFSPRYGASGVERAYDAMLAGRQGPSPAAEWLRELVGARRIGADVHLTIDAGLQEVADAALGDVRGAVVVLDLRSGAVLALLSKPYFNTGEVDTQWPNLSKDQTRPLYNRVSQGLYAPGSTFKVVTAAAALDAGLLQASTMVSDPTGDTTIEGFRITDAERPPRPTFDFAHALAWSSNVVFAQVGLQVGEPRLREYAGRFGMGKALPFELETSPTSIARTAPMPRVLLASTAFGQGELLMSPLQMALVAAAVGKDGDVPRPYIVAEVRAPDGTVLRRGERATLGRAISASTAQSLRNMLALSVEEGFSRNAAVPGVRVGGKTGTAQSVAGMPDHSWFIGLAPVEQPRVAVAVLMEFSGWGSLEAAPVARTVLERALQVAR